MKSIVLADVGGETPVMISAETVIPPGGETPTSSGPPGGETPVG